MHVIDLRSDTVTLPTEEMRKAMAEAEVGDDQSREDPTVNKLEELAAEIIGKEAALFVPSGVMGNLCAMLVHCERGQEVIMGDQSHILWYESGSGAALGGLVYRSVHNGRFGELNPSEVEETIRPERLGFPRTGLVCLENTHNRCGGTVLNLQQIEGIVDVAHRHNVPVHMDGARIFNAAIYLGVPVKELAKPVDSIEFCLSKGLSAPVGSIVAGSEDFVREARRVRKLLGGAMRQAGVIAAAGIVALEKMIDRLHEDHVNARKIAEGIVDLDGIRLDLETVQTNIVAFDLVSPDWTPPKLISELESRGLRISSYGGRKMRIVTHYGISDDEYDRAIKIFRDVLTGVYVSYPQH